MSFRLAVEAFDARVGNPLRKLVLLKLADQANDEGLCWPSYETIAKACEVDRRSVIRHIKKLEADNFLRIEKVYDKEAKKNKSNRYHLTIAKGVKKSLVTESHHPSDTESPLGGVTESLPSDTESPKPINESISKPINESTKVNVPFDDFWNLYDKKRGDKDKIEKKWQSLKDSEREAIMKHLPLYKKSQPNKKYRKDPVTYLNNKSWNDEIIFDDGQQPVSHEFHPSHVLDAPVFDEVALKTDPKVLAMIAAKRKGGSHGIA